MPRRICLYIYSVSCGHCALPVSKDFLPAVRFLTLAPYMIFQKMVSQGESFTLLAVPFFVAVGVIMNYSGIATRLMNVADMITGRMVGGLAQSNVVLSALMGGAA